MGPTARSKTGSVSMVPPSVSWMTAVLREPSRAMPMIGASPPRRRPSRGSPPKVPLWLSTRPMPARVGQLSWQPGLSEGRGHRGPPVGDRSAPPRLGSGVPRRPPPVSAVVVRDACHGRGHDQRRPRATRSRSAWAQLGGLAGLAQVHVGPGPRGRVAWADGWPGSRSTMVGVQPDVGQAARGAQRLDQHPRRLLGGGLGRVERPTG